ncbi:MAG: bifunctional glutamate N-acetyltransferase/amino-acid acetyltransferase ArgJ [Cyanobacteria bacterium]|nr:bifunctional glutamate N-acetyltransferase/amino-acid acetyltransferase ArgJ [Cyanobacteriota bacterium]
MPEVIKLRIDIYPIVDGLKGDYKIADHINLSGSAPNLGFNPITDLYTAKHEPDAIRHPAKQSCASDDDTKKNGVMQGMCPDSGNQHDSPIIVACLKPATRPSLAEIEVLKENGVKAYCYNLLEPALYAAAQGMQVEAVGFVPKLPEGFKFYCTATGLKTDPKKLDIAIAVADEPCYFAASFTSNKVRAACVENNKTIYARDTKVRALICNSGNANACTGAQGDLYDNKLRQAIADRFSLDTEEVLTASTGKIGIQLVIDTMTTAIQSAAQSTTLDFAEAILTTDLITKVHQNRHGLGICKGSGMIHPEMNQATMLGFIFSDVRLKGVDESQMQQEFRNVLQKSVNQSFNSISVDGDTSTNDMVLFMSSGKGALVDLDQFQDSMNELCRELAKKIVLDGEGATKIIQLNLQGLGNQETARKIARQVLNSLLVKTAIFGRDPNWGRIIAAMGQALAEHGLEVDMDQVSLDIQGQRVYESSMPTGFDKAALTEKLKKYKEIVIDLRVAEGGFVSVWSCDLSYDYVRINAEYFT